MTGDLAWQDFTLEKKVIQKNSYFMVKRYRPVFLHAYYLNLSIQGNVRRPLSESNKT